MKLNELKEKKIAIVGFGKEGKSLAFFLLKNRIKDITILDKNKKIKVPLSFKKVLGENYLKNLSSFGAIFLSPGVKKTKKEIERVERKISSPTSFFFDNFSGTIIGITGTKGKGTTASLIYKILKRAKFRKNIFLAGNIGFPLVSILEKTGKDSLVVAELSSFQLHNLKKSPQIALLTNLDRDHLDWHQSLRDYHQTKLNIFRFQTKKNLAIFDYSLRKKVEKLTQARKFSFSLFSKKANAFFEDGWLRIRIGRKEEKILEEREIKTTGQHFRKDILLASLCCYLLGIKKEIIAREIKNFRTSGHHLEMFFKKGKVCFFDDSSSTNPLASLEAIKSFSQPMIVILGGRDKGFDWQMLVSTIKDRKEKIKLIILIGENREKLKKLLPGEVKKVVLDDFEKLAQTIKENLFSEGVVLFSPGASSLDMFKNAKERGRIFQKIIKNNF